MPDHVHMVFEFDPRRMLHKVIKDGKGIISRRLREKHPTLNSRLPDFSRVDVRKENSFTNASPPNQ